MQYYKFSIFFPFQGKAEGQRSVVWIRARLQDQLSQLGYFLQRHAGKVLFVAILALATFCVALKSVQVNSKVDQLWVQGKWSLHSRCIFAVVKVCEICEEIKITGIIKLTHFIYNFTNLSINKRIDGHTLYDTCLKCRKCNNGKKRRASDRLSPNGGSLILPLHSPEARS